MLTGVSFDINGSTPTLALTSLSLTSGGDQYFVDKTTSSPAPSILGSWTNDLGASPIGDYGVATTGFGGAFSAAGISLGTGGSDYGIVADGTFPAPPGSGTSNSFNNAFPLIQNSLTFVFSGASGLTTSQITNVALLFGTSGEGIIPTTFIPPPPIVSPVPEPSTLAMAAGLGLGLAVGHLRRRRRVA